MQLRFVGDIDLLLGLLLAVAAAMLAWWLYRREVARGTTPLLALALPGLRAAVVLLLIMMLTGPVLHHRQVIGELGRVLVFVDASASMGVDDAHQPISRKLLLAHDRGWLPGDALNPALADAADALADARRLAARTTRDSTAATDALREAVEDFQDHVQLAATHLNAAPPRPLSAVEPDRGSILREWWLNVPGSDLQAALATDPLDQPPDGYDQIDTFDAPQNWADNYLQRIRGYIHPPADGAYTFWISSDDDSALYLSTDENPANAERIAFLRGHTSHGTWPEGDSRSASIELRAGRRYYIRALHKEGAGQDHVGVGWQLPDGTQQRPIPGEHLSPAAADAGDREMPFDEILAEFSRELASPALALSEGSEQEGAADELRYELAELGRRARAYKDTFRRAFADYAAEQAEAGDSVIQQALARFDSLTRLERVQSILLDERRGLLAHLAETHEVELLALDAAQPRSLWASATTADLPDALLADVLAMRTNLAAGIDARLRDLNDAPRAADIQLASQNASASGDADTSRRRTAAVLFSDGRHNHGDAPVTVAQLLGEQQVPFFSVGVGAVDPPDDLALVNIDAPQNVFRDDRVQGHLVMLDHMPPGQPFTAQIEHDGETVWQQELTTEGIGRRRIAFDFPLESLVEAEADRLEQQGVQAHAIPLSLTARIEPIEGEARGDNNALPLHLAASDREHRVLIVDGRARWEIRYLRNLFARDPRWDVNTVLAGPATEHAAITLGEESGDYPADRDALFDYDLIIFGELPAGLLDADHLEELRHFVEHRAGGVIFIDGRRAHLRGYEDSPLGPLLPVEWRDESAEPPLPTALALTDDGARRGALRLGGDFDNRELYTALPAPHWAAPVEVTPGVGEVLIEARYEDDDPQPVMVESRFGAGRVVYLGTDELWRWRYEVGDLYHQRFWQQLAGYVMESPYQVSDEFVSIDPGPMVQRPGEAEDVRVRLRDEQGRPVHEATAELVLWQDDEPVATIDLQSDADRGGVFRGRTPDLAPGAYEASVRVTGIPSDQLRARARFVVEDEPTTELAELALHEDLLRRMADASNGRYLREERASQLADWLEPLSAGRVIETETALWQSYWWFGAMIGLLSLEWLIRKRSGML